MLLAGSSLTGDIKSRNWPPANIMFPYFPHRTKQVPKNLFGKFTHSLTLREFASMILPIFPWSLTRFSIFNRTLNQRARNAPVVVLKLLQYALVFTTILSLFAFGIVENLRYLV